MEAGSAGPACRLVEAYPRCVEHITVAEDGNRRWPRVRVGTRGEGKMLRFPSWLCDAWGKASDVEAASRFRRPRLRRSKTAEEAKFRSAGG